MVLNDFIMKNSCLLLHWSSSLIPVKALIPVKVTLAVSDSIDLHMSEADAYIPIMNIKKILAHYFFHFSLQLMEN